MRRAVCAASRLSGVRFLQGPPGLDRHGGRVINLESRKFSAFFISSMRIAVDVMGGDHGCGVVIAGAKAALEANKKITALYLVGDQAAIHAALPPRGFRDPRVKVIHASEVVTMDDKPVVALRKKKDSSIA